MKAQILEYWSRLRSSFWFLPALMLVGAVALSYTTIYLDTVRPDEQLGALGWPYSGGAEGASSVLSTIAGGMITITGVVFSITLVALSLASSQLGSRLLRNFMRDTINQVALGTFIATFVYCLLVLRSIRRADEIAFVPNLSVTIGVVLAIASVGVLIYFIHNIALSIQADEMVGRVGKELIQGIDRMFPNALGREGLQTSIQPSDVDLSESFYREARAVDADKDGYVRSIDLGELIELATKEDLVFRVERGPGTYVAADRPLGLLWPGDRVTDQLASQVNDAFIVGNTRSSDQDLIFLVDQLVEIAVRALSPSLNDPFTVLRCVDRLGSALVRVVQRDIPSPYHYDEANELRVVAPVISFPVIADAAFNQIRQYAGSSVSVNIHLLETIDLIAESVTRPEDRASLRRHADMIARGAREAIPEKEDRWAVDQHYQAVMDRLSEPVDGDE